MIGFASDKSSDGISIGVHMGGQSMTSIEQRDSPGKNQLWIVMDMDFNRPCHLVGHAPITHKPGNARSVMVCQRIVAHDQAMIGIDLNSRIAIRLVEPRLAQALVYTISTHDQMVIQSWIKSSIQRVDAFGQTTNIDPSMIRYHIIVHDCRCTAILGTIENDGILISKTQSRIGG